MVLPTYTAEAFDDLFLHDRLTDHHISAIIERLKAAEAVLLKLRRPLGPGTRELVVTDAVYDAYGYWELLATTREAVHA